MSCSEGGKSWESSQPAHHRPPGAHGGDLDGVRPAKTLTLQHLECLSVLRQQLWPSSGSLLKSKEENACARLVCARVSRFPSPRKWGVRWWHGLHADFWHTGAVFAPSAHPSLLLSPCRGIVPNLGVLCKHGVCFLRTPKPP